MGMDAASNQPPRSAARKAEYHREDDAAYARSAMQPIFTPASACCPAPLWVSNTNLCLAAGTAAVIGGNQVAATVATGGQETIRMDGTVSRTGEDAAMTAMTSMNEEIANGAARADIGCKPCATTTC